MHDSPAGRQQHMRGARHRDKFKEFFHTVYPEWALDNMDAVRQHQMDEQQKMMEQMGLSMPGAVPGMPGVAGVPAGAAAIAATGTPLPGMIPPVGMPPAGMPMGAPPAAGAAPPTFKPPPKFAKPPTFARPPPKK